MIIANGMLAVKHKLSEGALDAATGYPMVGQAVWSRPVPCQIIPTAVDRQAVVSGEHYTMATYTVLVEGRLTAEQIRLYDADERQIGDYSVRSAEYLAAVDETRLTL